MEGFLATCVRISALPSVVNTHLVIIPLFPLLSRKLSQERKINLCKIHPWSLPNPLTFPTINSSI